MNERMLLLNRGVKFAQMSDGHAFPVQRLLRNRSEILRENLGAYATLVQAETWLSSAIHPTGENHLYSRRKCGQRFDLVEAVHGRIPLHLKRNASSQKHAEDHWDFHRSDLLEIATKF